MTYEDGWNDALRGSETTVGLYEREFYVLSNFSSFAIDFEGMRFPTSEHLYHWFKFKDHWVNQNLIQLAPSAHDAYKKSQEWKSKQRKDWDEVKLDIMYNILMLKVQQHPYVKQKLFETGKRLIVEDSHRDDWWGWGPNKDGLNMLGKLWMRVRSEIFPELA